MHNWTVKKVYFYAVSLILLIAILTNLTSIVSSLVQIAFPSPVYPSQRSYNDAKNLLLTEKYGDAKSGTVTPEEVKEFVEQRQRGARESQTFYAKQSLLQHIAYLIIIVPVYWYHWKIARTLE
ncbi:hypothetical protein [Coprothermobacter platensis]|uniref:hypothetical protein n=1 Tax=Coprothermobacter platensis TaxID=108819 RepID=UPI0009FC3153|nr:hypothetical protein [Coprothermobacter platensis]